MAPEDDDLDQDEMAAAWEAEATGDGGDDGADGGAEGGDGDDGDADAMAADWEASLSEDEEEEAMPGMSGAAERVLNQDEIDSLLGFEMDDDAGGDKTGIRAIINSALVSYERLPMLEIVFDRLVRLMTTSLRNFTSDNVEVSLDNITSIRFGDYLNSIPLPAILAVFRAREWDNFGLFTVDSNLIYSIVDVLLGGRRGTAAMRIEGRPYTTIELNLVQRMVEVVLQDACAAFEPLSPVNFELDRLETNPRWPMRPVVIGTPPERSCTVLLPVQLSISVWPTSNFITSRSDITCSSSSASSSTSVDHNSVARWPSQIESRPNFSPMNICSSSSRMGSSVA